MKEKCYRKILIFIFTVLNTMLVAAPAQSEINYYPYAGNYLPYWRTFRPQYYPPYAYPFYSAPQWSARGFVNPYSGEYHINVKVRNISRYDMYRIWLLYRGAGY